ncbi:DUF3987 domain-containing protein [Shewanella gelidimarina]|uniref:DUF3987 domain-containing protein n=1 Tax=Shewanella gelidimarina TaxID=56813 RepID=UPI00200BC6DA|nr:DUF3987 domain-containing protein [Shewanella gelidimarina]MCL1059742.1 DUF3987 domain-containing protein [Shewanella gelidimarina]
MQSPINLLNMFTRSTKKKFKETNKGELSDSENIQWQVPTPLNTTLLPVLAFEAEMLPEGVRNYVIKHALRVNNAPVDYAALSVIVAAGSLVGGSVEIHPKKNDTEWALAPNLFSMIIGEPSAQKTPMLKCGLNLLDFVQKVSINKINIVNSSFHKLQKQEYEAQKKSINNEAEELIQSGEVEQAYNVLKKMGELDEPGQIIREVTINDATIEAVLDGLQTNPHGSLIFRDEINGWLKAIEQRELERSLYLEAFDASKSPYVQKRIGREDVTVPRLILSLLGGIQPSVILHLLSSSNHSGHTNDGLLERLLQVSIYPDKTHAYFVDEAPDHAEIENVQNIFLTLFKLTQKKGILGFKFMDDAQNVWSEWSAKLIQKTKEADVSLQSFYGKNHATCAKIALILHLLDEASNAETNQEFNPSEVINLKTVENAIGWMTYLESHTKRILALVSSKNELLPAEFLFNNLNKLAPKFTRQQLSQKNWKGLNNKEDRELAIAELIKSGYIFEVSKPSKAFIVNPLHQL